MALTRVWTPSGNYSGGGTKRLIVIHTMEGFTGPNGAYDCAKYFQGPVGTSSQVCIDNNRGKVWEGVSRGNASWTQCNYNGAAVSCEQSGYASWSRSYWLANRDAQLHNIADWIAEESRALGIPVTDLSSSQAQGSGWGVCYHSELGSSGCGHSDPGSGWPIDVVLDWARGGGTAAPEPEPEPAYLEDDMPVIPPADVSDRQIAICVNGPHKDLGFCVDAAVLSGPVQIRCAFHIINGGWKVIDLTINPDNIRPVICPRDAGNNKMAWDGLSLHRRDSMPVDVWPVPVPAY
jgi:hypothetical protein